MEGDTMTPEEKEMSRVNRHVGNSNAKVFYLEMF
jgi:hypothetical protein